MIGETGTYCHRKRMRGKLYYYPAITLGMCDAKAVEMVAKDWGTPIRMKRPKLKCPPTPENSEEYLYSTTAESYPAQRIINKHLDALTNTLLHKRWQALLERCPCHPKQENPDANHHPKP